MFEYESSDIDERKLEDMVRQAPGLIEDGLKFVDRQRLITRGRLDVLFVDSGNALVVAELKAHEDDNMLMQALDYYDHVSTNVDSLARVYKDFGIDATQPVRLMLIALSFSQALINRCKWIDEETKISLFSYKYIVKKDTKEDTIVYVEVKIPPKPKREEEYNIPKILNYIRNESVKQLADRFLKEVESWNPKAIEVAPRKNKIVINVSGAKIAKKVVEVWTGREHWDVEILDVEDGKWQSVRVRDEDDYNNKLIPLLKTNFVKAGVEWDRNEIR